MRSMWKGSVAFGLVNVPVKLYAATEDHDVRFHQVHAADGGRVKMVRTCSIDGQPIPYADLAKAYETPSGEIVVMQDEDFENLPVAGKREIEVLEFVPSDQVDPMLFDRSYYLEPESRSLKPYVLLREALRETERTALVRVVLRQKTQLAALRVRDDVIVLQTMLWPDEVRRPAFDVLDDDVEVRPQELTMASSLIDSLSGDFDAEAYHDEYREALLAVIDAKIAGGAGVAAPAAAEGDEPADGVVVDLMAALRESVERNRRTAGESAAAAEPAEEEATAAKPARARAAKKTAAAEKTTGRSSAKKTASTAKPAPAKKAAKKAAEPAKAGRRSA